MKKLLLLTLLTIPLFAQEIVIDKTFFKRDDSKEVVTEMINGLMWQDDKRAKTTQRTWRGAKSYCKRLRHAGFSDWYLPSKDELETLIGENNSIVESFRNLANNSNYSNIPSYWTSTVYEINPLNAWYVYFNGGGSAYNYKEDNNLFVRCARAGQSDTLNFEKLVSKLIEEELKNIPKPPSELKLIKDEFETTKEFEARVKKTKAKHKKEIEKYKAKYASVKKSAKDKAIKKALEYTWGKPLLSDLKYDADNGMFVANVKFEAKSDFKSKKVAIKVPRKYARGFKKGFESLKPQTVFDYDGESVRLKDIRIPYKKHNYMAMFTDMNIDDTKVAVNIKSDELKLESSFDTKISVSKSEVGSFDASKLNNYSELDTLLKRAKAVKTSKKKWFFVVGIENYEYTDNIAYAKRSAQMFVKTAQKRLGVPKQNSFVLINDNATQAEIKTNLRKMLRRVKKGDTIYFYYNGHGVPVPSLKNEPFMLASNSEPDFIADEKYFSLQNIYSKLSGSKAAKVVAFVDSCFSGVTDGKAVLKGVAATKMVAKSVKFDKEKMVVISAGKSNQYSNGYDKKAHRLFSFYLMKNIIEGDSDIKTLFQDTKSQTYETSLEEYGNLRVQEPTVEGNYRMSL